MGRAPPAPVRPRRAAAAGQAHLLGRVPGAAVPRGRRRRRRGIVNLNNLGLRSPLTASLPTAQNVFILAVADGRGEDIACDSVLTTTLLAMPAMLLVVALMAGG